MIIKIAHQKLTKLAVFAKLSGTNPRYQHWFRLPMPAAGLSFLLLAVPALPCPRGNPWFFSSFSAGKWWSPRIENNKVIQICSRLMVLGYINFRKRRHLAMPGKSTPNKSWCAIPSHPGHKKNTKMGRWLKIWSSTFCSIYLGMTTLLKWPFMWHVQWHHTSNQRLSSCTSPLAFALNSTGFSHASPSKTYVPRSENGSCGFPKSWGYPKWMVYQWKSH